MITTNLLVILSLVTLQKQMFEIGFAELVVCAIVALVVLGPERLPEALKFLGRLFAKLQRVWQSINSDVGTKFHD